jgi:hypothetical protein
MTDRKFEEYRRELLEYDRETIHFLSSQKKSERERCVCAAFLRCLGVDFSVAELVAVPESQSPPDVAFREACFEVCDVVLDAGRRPHGEAKARVAHLEQAQTIDDVLVPVRHRVSLAYVEVFHHVTEALAKKAARYGMVVCANLDALVYVRLQNMFLDSGSSLPSCAALTKQGWRSVSFVMPPYSHVIHAGEGAPAFLGAFVGQTRQEWHEPDTFFAL